ncbi:MAG: 50S ribosome-binding GTPase [Acidobacteriota bacterium]|nr:50S ribosome-binding GTPase [Acidobacteriota bacterium]
MARRVQAATLGERVESLLDAADLASGRLDVAAVDEARRVARQVDRRLAFAGDDTVVALAGATGSGKSSLFNAISGTRLAEPGLKRPTTNKAMAAYWGPELPADLLDWLDVPRRHLVQGDDPAFNGLILVDLPDHDSTETAHRQEVDRLVKLVDMLIWVVDPQKYADAALHNNYLKPLAGHADVMLVVLNQADRLTGDQLRQTMRDLRKLLDSEGLGEAPLVAASALTGLGVESLRKTIAAAVKGKHAAAARLAGDVARAGHDLREAYGDQRVSQKVPDARARQLNESLAQAAGVDIVRDAVLQSTRHRGTLATGWPVTAWLSRFRPDPLRMLHLDRALPAKLGKKKTPELAPVTVQRTSLPTAGGVQEARVDAALRELAEGASEGLPPGWSKVVRAATIAHRDTLADELDQAVATTDLAMDRGQGWWKAVTVLQWLVFVVAVAGGVWLLIDVALAYMQLPQLPTVLIGRLPLPTAMLIGGALAGVLTGLLARIGVEVGARAKAARAERVLVRSVTDVADRLVIAPVNQELTRFNRGRDQAARAMA